MEPLDAAEMAWARRAAGAGDPGAPAVASAQLLSADDMKAAALAVAGAAGVAATEGGVNPGSSIWSPQTGVTYDLTALMNTNGLDYVWDDPHDDLTTNSTYYFNILQDVYNPPAPCKGQPAAAAYQQDNTNPKDPMCYPLSGDFNGKQPEMFFKYSQADPYNIAGGVALLYKGATQACAGGATGYRSFQLNFLCNKNTAFPPATGTLDPNDDHHWIDEVDDCVYVAYTYSTAGCPTQCPVVNGVVCGNTGVCGFDDSYSNGQGAARCFCSDGWTGADCQTALDGHDTYPGGSIAGAVFGGILVGAVGLVGYTWFRARSNGGHKRLDTVEGFY